ncbi:MAG: hypothetical protein EXQ95_13450 [Alphaproteobacteria bacterium]|nr:hypothetical protein [Alphaproteobacteria bacterium]
MTGDVDLPVDLQAEAMHAGANMVGKLGWLQAGAGRIGEIGWLAAMGVARGFVLSGGVGRDHVQFQNEHSSYVPSDDADAVEALILGCWSDRPNFSELVDLVALQVGGEGRSATRCGRALALGRSTVEIFDGATVPFFSDAWSWLRRGASGVLLLEIDSADVGALLLQFANTKIDAESYEFGEQLQQVIRRSQPQIRVPI